MSNDKVNIIKATQDLKKKAGTGQVSPEKIKAGEKVLEDSSSSFLMIARESLADLKTGVDTAKSEDVSKEQLLEMIQSPLMHLKSSAGMFNYSLVGEMADIMFNFLERVEVVDDKAIEIVEAHHTTLQAIVGNRMEGDGGDYGKKLKKELAKVCDRYFEKNT